MSGLFAQLDMSTSQTVSAPQYTPEKKVSKLFAAGEHEIKITEVSQPVTSGRDSTWNYIRVSFTDVEGIKKNSFFVNIPTVGLAFKDDTKGMTEFKLRKFLQAMGCEASNESLKNDLNNVLGNPQKLVGRTLRVVLGYGSHHTGWDKENKKVTLCDKDGSPLSERGEVLLFDSRDSAEAYAGSKGLKFSNFVEVKQFVPSELKAAPIKKSGFGK